MGGAAGGLWVVVVAVAGGWLGAALTGAGVLIGLAGALGTAGIVDSVTSTFVVGRGVNLLRAAAAFCDGLISILTPTALGTALWAFT